MTMYLLSGNRGAAQAIEQRVELTFPGIKKITRLEQIPPGDPDGGEPDHVLFPAPPGEKAFIERLIELAPHYREHLFFVLVCDEISASDYKRLVRTGNADWISARASSREFHDAVRRQRRPVTNSPAPNLDITRATIPDAVVSRPTIPASTVSRPAVGHAAVSRTAVARPTVPVTRPVLVSFVPSAGGVGNTTLAIETAVRIKLGKATRDASVCIIDLDFQSSHVCDHLDIEPRLRIQEVIDDPDRFDDQVFEVFVSRHSSGVHVLAAPRNKAARSEVNISALDPLFEKMAKRYDYIFVDLPTSWSSWTRAVLAASNGIVVTGINTVPSLRQVVGTLAAVRANGAAPSDIVVAVNRCPYRRLGGFVRRQHVDAILGSENVILVSEDPCAIDSANAGVPVAVGYPLSKINKDVGALVEFCRKLRSSPSRHTSTIKES